MKFSVAKFGGTSMADAHIILKSAQVVAKKNDIRLCVISATSGTTNQLLSMSEQAKTGKIPLHEFEQFEKRHTTISLGLESNPEIKDKIQQSIKRVKELLEAFALLKQTPLSALDEIASQGEVISSYLFLSALRNLKIPSHLVDAREIMKTSSDFGKAKPHLDLIKTLSQEKIAPLLKDAVIVTQGYIGSDLENRTTTLGKEGSDYSTALFAEALEASEVQIWKDVPGIMTTDPRIVPTAKTLHFISFDEVSELTRFGAKVIHPDTFLPVIRQGIPVYVGYSQNPELTGTKITAMTEASSLVHALSLKKDVTLLSFKTNDPLEDFLSLLPPFIHLSSSNQKFIFIFDKLSSPSKDQIKSLEKKGLCHMKTFDLIALVGPSLPYTDLLKDLSSYFENPRYINYGTSETSMTFTVPSGEGENWIKKLHTHFIEKP
jgi:aspartate kinase